MEEEAYRLRTTALTLKALEPCPGITADMVAMAVESKLHFAWRDISVTPFFPEDFLLTMFELHQRGLVLEQRVIKVAEVKFKIMPWFPPSTGVHRIWRYYCRVVVDRLPLNAWDREKVVRLLGDDCVLDHIEQQSVTRANCSALFAWAWTWNPDKIPRASDFNILQRPDGARPRDSVPEGTPLEEGLEGLCYPVLIHLDVVKDYTPISRTATPIADDNPE